jgi:hypothetical protein
LGSSQIFGELFTFFPSQTTTHPFLQNIRVILAYIVAGILFLRWLNTSYENIARAELHQSYNGYWAIWSWFVPIMNLFAPYQIMQETYKGTQYAQHRNINQTKDSPQLNWWWFVLIVSYLLDRVSNALIRNAKTPEEATFAFQVSLLDTFVSIVSVLLALRFMQALIKEEEKLWNLYENQDDTSLVENNKPETPNPNNDITWV